MSNTQQAEAIAYLRSPKAIRERCGAIYDLAAQGKAKHFYLHLDKLAEAAAMVLQVTRAAYPTLDVPYHSRWRHFDAGNIPRVQRFSEAIANSSAAEQGRARFELAIVSVLLDAGAGMSWGYKDAASNVTYTKSEGLAVASYEMFLAGLFSGDKRKRLRVDAVGLAALKESDLAHGFQVTPSNPLVGLKGRLALLQRLGEQIVAAPEFFREANTSNYRLGGLFDFLAAKATNKSLPAREILNAVLEALGPIWPGRVFIGQTNLGDVWTHSLLQDQQPAPGLVPFHKLSQWLTYSLVEPLEWAGIRVTDLDELTGLPEYRNGGLFLDTGVLTLKSAADATKTFKPDAELIVEWRALTVILLDRIAALIRADLAMDATTLPLAKVLQGGTWTTGRLLAREKRSDGGPPLKIDSDGTVF